MENPAYGYFFLPFFVFFFFFWHSCLKHLVEKLTAAIEA